MSAIQRAYMQVGTARMGLVLAFEMVDVHRLDGHAVADLAPVLVQWLLGFRTSQALAHVIR